MAQSVFLHSCVQGINQALGGAPNGMRLNNITSAFPECSLEFHRALISDLRTTQGVHGRKRPIPRDTKGER